MIHNPLLPPPPFTAINLFGCIFVRYGARLTDSDLRHEAIHTRQIRELLYVGFYIAYIAEWLFRLLLCRGNAMRAYRTISFEREAYRHQHEPDYLRHRRHFAWLRGGKS